MSNPNNQNQHSRKQYSAIFKAQVVLEALREQKSIAQIASEHQLHPNLVTKWKQEALAELPTVFERKNSQAQAQEAHEQKMAQLYQEIGRLTTQVNWLKKNLAWNLTPEQRMLLVERASERTSEQEEADALPLVWQTDLLSLSRSRLYYDCTMSHGLRGKKTSGSSTAWTSGTQSARAWERANL